MVQARARVVAAGGDWSAQAVAITMGGSHLDQEAKAAGWLRRFDMFDWVGAAPASPVRWACCPPP